VARCDVMGPDWAQASPIHRQAAHAGFDLMLSGHTHGGQICLRGGVPILLQAKCPCLRRSRMATFGLYFGGDGSSRSREASHELTEQLPDRSPVDSFRSSVAASDGIAFRQASPRRLRPASLETPALRRRAQRLSGVSRFRPLSMPARSPFPPRTSDPSCERSPRQRPRPPWTKLRVRFVSEPSWVATSSAMNSNPANAGSGVCPRAGETGQASGGNRTTALAYRVQQRRMMDIEFVN
jgi:hypothetical protein